MAPHLEASGRQPRTLASYAQAVRRHPILVTLAIAAALVGALAWLAIREPEYRATARVLIDPASSADETLLGLPLVRDAGDPTRTAQTAAALLRSPDAAAATARRLGGGATTRSVLDAVAIEPAGESNILAVTAGADSAAGAARLANAFAAATLADRDAKLSAAIERELEAAPAAAPGTEPRVLRLEALSGSGDPTVSLADEALPPRSPSESPWWLVLTLALIAGAVAGAIAAIVADMRSPRRLVGEDELRELMPEPVLARLPDGWHRFRGEPSMRYPTAADVAFRSLEVQLGLLDGTSRVVAVSSPGEDDGKTTLVASLALRLASEDERVVVIDADLHGPGVADLLGAPSEPGLADVLESGAPLEAALTEVWGVPGLEVLPGMRDTRLSTLAAVRQRLPALIAEAREGGGHVLIDTAPLGTVGDAVLLLDGVDELLLVARAGHTRVAAIEAARDALWRLSQTASGFVLIGDEHSVTTPSHAWPRLTPEPEPPAVMAVVEPPPEPETAERPELWVGSVPPSVDGFAPGDRVRWQRGAAHGIGTIERRLPGREAHNGSPPRADEEPRYLVTTDRTGRALACRASALTRATERG
jgi:Mrp family chromosome partitioning ATPase